MSKIFRKNGSDGVHFYLFTLTIPSISYRVFIKPLNLPQKDVEIKIFVIFLFHQENLKTEKLSFQPANLLKIEIFRNVFGVFCLRSRNTYFNEH